MTSDRAPSGEREPASHIMLAGPIHRRPVVTFDGEDIAQVRDIVYAGDGGRIAGFTLAGRGLLSGPMKTALPWRAVVGLGPAAVVVRDADVLVATGEVFEQARSESGPGRGNVIGSEVLTDDGSALGVVTDVVVRIPSGGAIPGGNAAGVAEAEVVGYAIGALGKRRRGEPAQFVPLPESLSASGEHLIVPARIRRYLTDDLARFGASVEAFRRDERSDGGADA